LWVKLHDISPSVTVAEILDKCKPGLTVIELEFLGKEFFSVEDSEGNEYVIQVFRVFNIIIFQKFVGMLIPGNEEFRAT
jgi:hypothetical protein